MILLYGWCALLSAGVAFCVALLWRHRRYLLQLEARLPQDGQTPEPAEPRPDFSRALCEMLIDMDVHNRTREWRERWTREAPMGDKAIQKECLAFLDELDRVKARRD